MTVCRQCGNTITPGPPGLWKTTEAQTAVGRYVCSMSMDPVLGRVHVPVSRDDVIRDLVRVFLS